jgi:hypothetical protein
LHRQHLRRQLIALASLVLRAIADGAMFAGPIG